MKDIEITRLIPQRPPFVMIDSLIYCNDAKAITTFNLRDDNILCESGIFLEAGLIENMAQTAAARMGYIKHLNAEIVSLGFIGGIRNLKVYSLPRVHDQLTTEIEVVNEIMGFVIVMAKVFTAGILCAECEIRVFLVQESSAF